MSAATASRRARRFVLVGAGFLLAWQVGALVGIPRRTEVVLGLYGFVLHTISGKAYSLVPSYFARRLAVPRAPTLHLPFTAGGTVGLALATVDAIPPILGTLGAAAWAIGVGVFLAALLRSVRDNLSGRETGTGDANAARRPVDRAANAFVPVALAYLALGSYETLAAHIGLPSPFHGVLPRGSHLLAAGTGAMLVFAIGFRLLPRFLVASPPRPLVAVVLPAGAIGPVLLAATLGGGPSFRVAALLEAVAVIGFGAAYATTWYRSDRRRVGLYGVLLGALSGVLAALLGLSFAFGSISAPLTVAHLRLNLLGFLGLTIVGVAYQFYPPAIGSFPGANDRTALASILCLGGGLLVEVLGLASGTALATTVGESVALVGAGLYAYLVAGVFHER
ncbi:hypothetical protein ACFQPA_18640 [Halomarina halobia]|uniref:Uncharacterized protein n=1 Tax=Halomarina halobia TaxID=3033386 RepID=A0ABD6AEE7_9EURY|nr:hypothetical protein [Halomarina sp. PSR21]